MATSLLCKVVGVVACSLASYYTAYCLVQPIDPSTTHLTARMSDSSSLQDAILFDFTSNDADVSGWIESSDTVRKPGMSKAVIAIQKTQLFQRAVFFALLNPQPNGAGFAGVRHPVRFDLSRFSSLELKVRGQGLTTHFKVVLKHHNEVGDGSPSYEQFFTAPRDNMQTIVLPLFNFKPYWRGQPLNDTTDPLDTTNITSLGIQFYGGVYEQDKQSGPATLEIDWIKASI